MAADLADPETLRPYLRGVEAVFLIWPFVDPAAAAQLAPRLTGVLASAGSPRVVYMSAASTGIATNTLGWAASIRTEGVVRWPYGTAARSLSSLRHRKTFCVSMQDVGTSPDALVGLGVPCA